MIPLTVEEYFENEVCMNCQTAVFQCHDFYMPDGRILSFCGHCAFGLHQCSVCRCLVSSYEDAPYRRMFYQGPEGTFEESFIFCTSCADTDADTEMEDADVCAVDDETQTI